MKFAIWFGVIGMLCSTSIYADQRARYKAEKSKKHEAMNDKHRACLKDAIQPTDLAEREKALESCFAEMDEHMAHMKEHRAMHKKGVEPKMETKSEAPTPSEMPAH